LASKSWFLANAWTLASVLFKSRL